MLIKNSRRSGFTLPEVLVTVAIVAVLAAVVVPTVTSQISKGDDANFQTSLTNVRTGITAFVSDTRKFPRHVSDLHNAIDDLYLDIFGTAYGTSAEGRWKGPYVSGALARNADLDLSHAFLADSLIDSSFVLPATGYVIGSIKGVTTQTSAAYLDALIDGGNGSTAGILRWTPASGAITSGNVKIQVMGSR